MTRQHAQHGCGSCSGTCVTPDACRQPEPGHPDADPPMTWGDVGHIAVAVTCVLAAVVVCWVMPMGPAQ